MTTLHPSDFRAAHGRVYGNHLFDRPGVGTDVPGTV